MLHGPSFFDITSRIFNLYPSNLDWVTSDNFATNLRLSIFHNCLCLEVAFFLKSDKTSEELYSPNYRAYKKIKTAKL